MLGLGMGKGDNSHDLPAHGPPHCSLPFDVDCSSPVCRMVGGDVLGGVGDLWDVMFSCSSSYFFKKFAT